MSQTMATPNGRVRKSLADQIDRLDGILDGLADGLQDAVVTAVQQAVVLAVREGVRGVMLEVLANPELLAKVAGNAAPAPVPEAPVAAPIPQPSRVRTVCGKVCQWVGAALTAFRQVCHNGLRRVRRGMIAVCQRLQVVRQYHFQMVNAIGVGMVIACAAYFAGPWLAAAASGVGGFATTMAVHMGLAVRKWVAERARYESAV